MSELVIEMLKRHEGFRQYVYTCPAGKLTVGYGRNLEQRGVTEAEAAMLLQNDVDVLTRQLEAYDWFKGLDEIRRAAIVNMTYNLGLSGLLKFKKMIGCLEKRDLEGASREMLDSVWARQVPVRAKELAELMRVGG